MIPARWKAVAGAAILVAWFLAHTWRGLLVYFQGDDMMNMYWAWDTPWPKLALANLSPFTAVYRPSGAVFYRVMYSLAGFNPAPFRVVCYLLLAVNIGLAYRTAKALTESAEIAWLAALLVSWHSHLMDLYQNDGAVYDILCFTFFYGALSVYCSARRSGSPLTLRALVGFLALFVLAMNSKEMAATLPAAVWLYELIYWPPDAWTPRAAARWLYSGKLAVWIASAAVPLALAAKTSASSVMANSPSYAVALSLSQYFVTTRSWLGQLFFLPQDALGSPGAAAILALVVALAALSGRKYLRYGAALILILPLPVNFIALRNFFVMYIPLLAWAVFLAGVLVEARNWLSRPRTWVQITALPVILALGLSWAASQDRFRSFDWIDPTQTQLRALHSGLIQNCPPGKGSGLLLRNDPFEKDDWAPVLAARLLYEDKLLQVDRDSSAGTDYRCILDFDGKNFVGKAE